MERSLSLKSTFSKYFSFKLLFTSFHDCRVHNFEVYEDEVKVMNVVEMKLVPGFDLPGDFSFCGFSFGKKTSYDTKFPGRFLNGLFESQTLGTVEQKHSKIKITEIFNTLVYLIKTRMIFFPLLQSRNYVCSNQRVTFSAGQI